MSMFNVNIYIYIKNKTFIILHELYFGFFQTFEDSIKVSNRDITRE